MFRCPTLPLAATTALSIAALPTTAIADPPVTVVLRYRTVYVQSEPAIPNGRWSETSALRLHLDGTGGVVIEGLADRSSPSATRVTRRDGETLDVGAYRASYVVSGASRVTIRADYPGFTLVRDVRIGTDGCTADVAYIPKGIGDIAMPLPDGRPAKFRRLFAREPSCRIETAADDATPLAAGCRFQWNEAAKLFEMRVARGAVCVGRFGSTLRGPKAVVVAPPEHGRLHRIDAAAMRYTPADGFVGRDRFQVEVTGASAAGPVAVRRRIDVEVVR